MADAPLPYDLYGDAEPASPVILSVPHAGRDYPLALRAALRVLAFETAAGEPRQIVVAGYEPPAPKSESQSEI